MFFVAALGVSVDQAICYRREIVKAVGGQGGPTSTSGSQPQSVLGSGQTAFELLSQVSLALLCLAYAARLSGRLVILQRQLFVCAALAEEGSVRHPHILFGP